MSATPFELVGLGRCFAPSNVVAGRVEAGESDDRALLDFRVPHLILARERAQELPPATTSSVSDLVPYQMAWIEQLKAIGQTFAFAVAGTLSLPLAAS